MLRRSLGASVIALLFVVPVGGSGAEVAAADACARSTTVASDRGTRLQVRRAVMCLVNGLRADRGLRRLRAQRQLASAARFHSRDMVGHKYFDHHGSRGDDLATRLRHAGYFASHPTASASEALAWGTNASAQDLVDALMASPAHRSLLLDPSAREIGLGLTLGAPTNGVAGSAATLVLDFGE
jgi:uncharacterized protein YkwD